MRARPLRTWRAALGAAVGLALLLTGCQSGDDSSGSDSAVRGANPSTATPPASAELAVAPADGSTKVRLDKDVRITVAAGTLSSVSVEAEDGAALAGALSPDRTRWTSTGELEPAATYTVKASAADAGGRTSTHSSSFTTLKPKSTASVSILPSDGWTVGIGMPVIVDFSSAVAVKQRGDVEQALSVSSSPSVEGGWRWFSSRQVQWRPAEYWPSQTKVTVAADLAGIEVAPGVWGSQTSRNVGFTVGSAVINTVDVGKHQLTMRREGKVVRTIPVTTGKSGFATRNGTKVIMSRETSRRMDAATTGTDPGDPEYYDITVKYAMRLTYSGEFLHAAPWSVASQGHANVSHGCTGMSTENAKWLFSQSKVGDVVVFTGSKRSLEWGNGYTAWDMSYARWKNA